MADSTDVNDGRKYQEGESLKTDQGNMVVHGVAYQERVNESGDTERHNFSYILRHEDDIKAEQEAAAEAARQAEEARKLSEEQREAEERRVAEEAQANAKQ